jgi:hypothetical protein
MENAYVGFCLYLKRARRYQMPSFVPTFDIHTVYSFVFCIHGMGSLLDLPVNDAFCMFCNFSIKMFITECWQGSVFACVVNGVTSSHEGNAHCVIYEAKFGLEPPTNVAFQC